MILQRFIPNNYIVDEKIIDEYIQKKDDLMKERNSKAVLNILFTILITGLYYADIISRSKSGDVNIRKNHE